MSQQVIYETLILVAGESKTFGFDYSKHGGVRGGAVLSGTPVFTFEDAGSGVTAGTPEVTTEDFFDFGTNRKIPSGKGVIVLLDATSTVTPGRYVVSMKVAVGTDPGVKLLGKLLVVDAEGSIP